jgi:7-carboxy-7-deazaguanine synthase
MGAAQLARAHAAATASLVVSEVFGPTVQGEGPSTGKRAAFIRLGGCNLHCTWCDTDYTWDATRHDLRAELHRRPVREVLAQVLAYGVPLVVITGGEPLLHQGQDGWRHLLQGITSHGLEVEVETNGTQAPDPWTQRRVTRFNVSPKLRHADGGRDPETARIVPAALAQFARLATHRWTVFKFVCQTTADLEEVAQLVKEYQLPPDSVWVMPEGTTPDAVLATGRELADPTIAAGYNITTRLHTLLWGSERAR